MKRLLYFFCCLFVSCSEENNLSTAELERNFALDTQLLRVTDAVFNPDFNILVVQLGEPPADGFWNSLAAKGWQKQGERYVNKQSFLEYHPNEKQLVIQSVLYLPLQDE